MNWPANHVPTKKPATHSNSSEPTSVGSRCCASVNHGAPHNVVIATNCAINTKCTQNENRVPRWLTTVRSVCAIRSVVEPSALSRAVGTEGPG